MDLYSNLHRDHLVILVGDPLLASASFAKAEAAVFLTAVAAQAAKESSNQEMADISKALNATSVADKAMLLGKALTVRLVDQATGTGNRGADRFGRKPSQDLTFNSTKTSRHQLIPALTRASCLSRELET